MKLPWSNSELKEKVKQLEEEVEDLETEIEELEKSKEKAENRFEAEKERRSELSRQKQEAEKQVKQLKKKLDDQKNPGNQEQPETEKIEKKGLKLKSVKKGLTRLGTVESDEDVLTVYSPGKVSEIDNFRDLKNTASKRTVEKMEGLESFILFTDELFIDVIIQTRPFFQDSWKMEGKFETEVLEKFIEKNKTWVVVSAGNTRIVKERNGEIEEVENVKTRVDRKHTQGGFSQGRFERKREEQIQNHLDAVREEVEADEPLLVGDRKLCKQLEGEYLGGFDDNKPLIDGLYNFQLIG